jgi:hypothetical protein
MFKPIAGLKPEGGQDASAGLKNPQPGPWVSLYPLGGQIFDSDQTRIGGQVDVAGRAIHGIQKICFPAGHKKRFLHLVTET